MTNSGFIKGVALGLVAGATIGVAVMPKSKSAKKTAGRFFRTIGEVMENISCIH